MTILIGAIADDFTGATDLANTLVKSGMRVVQVIGIPDNQIDIADAEAVVVALKSRTNPVDEAVSWSMAAFAWLKARGAVQIIFKYCSTFDSTEKGNIGPVADALLDALACDFAFVCPAFPDNGRTIHNGHLYVGDLLLSESSMSGRALVVAGSCSKATRAQIHYVQRNWPCFKLEIDAITSNKNMVSEVVAWANQQDKNLPILIYASSDPQEVSVVQQRYGVEKSGNLIEQCLSEIAGRLVDADFDRIIVAGGETSGAVISALDIKALRIVMEIDPGVPWAEALGNVPLALALKSGNFGTENFFEKAFEVLG